MSGENKLPKKPIRVGRAAENGTRPEAETKTERKTETEKSKIESEKASNPRTLGRSI
jgi:hypothetical protein